MAAAANKLQLFLALAILLTLPAAFGGPGGASAATDFAVTTTAPAAGTTVSGIVTWTAAVSGGTATRVEFYVDGRLRWTERSAPYARQWDTRGLAAGEHKLKLRAVDGSGATAWSESTVYVGSAPTADPAAPSTPTGFAIKSAAATAVALGWAPSTDNVGVTGYSVYVNGSPAGTTATTLYSVGNLTCGTSYSFAVDAFDAAGNRSTKASFAASTAACSSTTPPPPSSTGVVYVATTGSDGAACTAAAPCKTLDRAYRAATPGQRVELAAGTYPGQTLNADSTKTTSAVTFAPAAGSTVAFSGAVVVKAKYVEFRDMQFVPRVETSAAHVTFRNLNVRGPFDIMSNGTAYPSNISFIGGQIGPSIDKNVRIGSNGYTTSASPKNILFDGVRFHDFNKSAGSSAHVECLQVWAADGLTIRNSRFQNCEAFDLFLQKLPGGAAATPTNILLENNTFDCCRSGFYSIRMSDTHGENWKNVTIRNNSANKAFSLAPAVPYSNVHVVSNIAPKLDGAPSGVTVDYNVWYAGSKRGANDQVAAHGFTNASALDFRLVAGAAAIDRGHPTNHPATDFQGDPRPTGTAPDAGADESGESAAPAPAPTPTPDPDPGDGDSGVSGDASTAATLFVSTTGSDAAACTSAAPCRTLNRAYRMAKPGTTVQVAGGTYAAQTIQSDSSKTAPAVVFRPAAGADVTLGSLDVYASHLEVRGMRVYPRWYVYAGANGVTMRDVRAERFVIASASNVSVLGGDYGPSIDSVSAIKSAEGSPVAPKNIVVDGVYIHDVNRPAGSSVHRECLHVMAADGLKIRNSRFHKCLHIGVSFNAHGDSGAMRGIVVENNWFGYIDGYNSINLSAGDPCEILIRYNTFRDKGIAPSCPETGLGVRIESNILPSMAGHICGQNGYAWNWNVYESGTKCGANDTVGAVSYVNRAGFDLRLLAGSAAIGRGNATSHPAADLFGGARPLGGAPDAGAHESA